MVWVDRQSLRVVVYYEPMFITFLLNYYGFICPGREIRHINDYAAILLVDARFACDSSKRNYSHPTNKLRQWIKGRLVSSTDN